MTLITIPAAAEILDVTPRHVHELIDVKELRGVDTAVHRAKPGTTEGSDGKRYPTRKRRLRVTAESVRLFIQRRTIGQQTAPQRRGRLQGIKHYL